MSYSPSERPNKVKSGGRGMYCCIPYCNSAQYDKEMNKTNIALFSFPNKEKKPDTYKAWCKEIQKFRRSGGQDFFKINKNTKVCEFHFKDEDIKVSLGRGIKTLKIGTEVPSIYPFKTPVESKYRKSPRKRLAMETTDADSDFGPQLTLLKMFVKNI